MLASMRSSRERSGDEDGEPLDALFRPLDRRRLREIRQWLEGTRPDAPTLEELREYVSWVSGEIERALARHQPTQDLLVLLNASRGQLHAMEEEARG
jgi:hypothetical protein